MSYCFFLYLNGSKKKKTNIEIGQLLLHMKQDPVNICLLEIFERIH